MALATLSVRTQDGTELCVGAQPCGGEGPVLLILHGLFSHMGWYRSLAEELAAAGAAVYMLDRRGAGLSQGTRGHMPNWPTLVRDVGAVAHEIRSLHPGRPLHCLGISLGGTISLAASILHPELFASQILLSPGLAAGFPVTLRKRLRLLRSFLLNPMQLFELPFAVETLTDHPRWRQALSADPLRTQQVSARFLVETFRMQRFVRARMPSVRVPLLMLLAAKDQLVDNEVAIAALRRAGSHRVRIEIFEGATHILPASVPSAELLQRFTHWLRQPGPAAREELSIVSVPAFPRDGGIAFDPPLLATRQGEETIR
jgi:alpha-beta hydrolase superfamily lysophospholipase